MKKCFYGLFSFTLLLVFITAISVLASESDGIMTTTKSVSNSSSEVILLDIGFGQAYFVKQSAFKGTQSYPLSVDEKIIHPGWKMNQKGKRITIRKKCFILRE